MFVLADSLPGLLRGSSTPRSGTTPLAPSAAARQLLLPPPPAASPPRWWQNGRLRDELVGAWAQLGALLEGGALPAAATALRSLPTAAATVMADISTALAEAAPELMELIPYVSSP